MKRLRPFFLLSFFLFFCGGLKDGSFVWAGGCFSSHKEYESIDGSPPKKETLKEKPHQKVGSTLEAAFKNADDFHTRLSGYIPKGDRWRIQKEEKISTLKILYGLKEVLIFTFLNVGTEISAAKKDIGKTLVSTIDLLNLFSKKTDQTIDVFLRKIEEDLKGMKVSSSMSKTFYMKARSAEKDPQKSYEFLILDGPRRALKIECTPQSFEASGGWETISL